MLNVVWVRALLALHVGEVIAQAYNTNDAGEFPLVDALFGTLCLPASRWPAQNGIHDTEPTGYLRQLAWPLRSRCAGDAGAVRPNLVEHSASAPSGKVF